jgi:hypothetical protein
MSEIIGGMRRVCWTDKDGREHSEWQPLPPAPGGPGNPVAPVTMSPDQIAATVAAALAPRMPAGWTQIIDCHGNPRWLRVGIDHEVQGG